MENIWYFKHCPQCGNYVKKRDPQESGMCCCCGWQEYVEAYYCEYRRRFCAQNERIQPMPERMNGTTIR